LKKISLGFVLLVIFLISFNFFFALPLHAEDKDKAVFAFVHENDLFAQRDQYYTSGVRFTYFSDRITAPGWLADFTSRIGIYEETADHRISYSVGQNMYTPRDITLRDPPEDDRPYAGWLYGSVGLIQDRGSRLDSFKIMLGVVGPSSGAEETQEKIHELVGGDDPKGWDHQLRDELGFRLIYGQRNVAWLQGGEDGLMLELAPAYSVSVGNIQTSADASMMFRWGNLSGRDHGPPLIYSGTPGAGFFIPGGNFEWYLYLNTRVRYVAHNIFLDGNTIHDSPSVDREPWLGEAQLGFALTWTDFRLSYTHVFPTKEFKTQENTDDYGAITLSTRF